MYYKLINQTQTEQMYQKPQKILNNLNKLREILSH